MLCSSMVGFHEQCKLEEGSHPDDIPLVSVYTSRNVLVRGMLIPDAFLTKAICATDDFKEYETMFMNGKKMKQTTRESCSPRKLHKITIRKKKHSITPIPPLGDDRERDEVAEATILSLTLHKTALAAKAQENIAKVQEKQTRRRLKIWLKVTKMKNHMQMSLLIQYLMTMLMISIEKEKKDEEIKNEKKDDNIEKTDEVVNKKDIVDDVTGSMGIRKERKQTPTPSPIRSPMNVSSSDKTVYEELTATAIPEITFSKTNEMIREEMPCLVHLAVKKDREVDPIHAQEMIAKEFATHGPKMTEELFRKHIQNTLNLYPTTSTSTAGKSSADLQHQLYEHHTDANPPKGEKHGEKIFWKTKANVKKKSFVNGKPILPTMKRL
uniref:Uncharacterized protein n=1 Tax=Tanacetum cinerariifolium TaxID=118510 RepID=A0A699JAC9_TANCI|nr:hypothetical protein [Tanacetum cinerariifolium]